MVGTAVAIVAQVMPEELLEWGGLCGGRGVVSQRRHDVSYCTRRFFLCKDPGSPDVTWFLRRCHLRAALMLTTEMHMPMAPATGL